MRIAVIGGGPSGLYFSILMKRADPAHEITVYERNPPDATFGWGVVFSEETLGALRDADFESYVEITDSFAAWNTIEIRHGGHVVRSRGHAFSAIARKTLLGILQRRARELGVDLRFEHEVSELPEADLVVGADGVNSLVRARHAEALMPKVAPFASRFVWFGTDLVFDAFTFVFRETEHGMFQVHAYPFDASTSTFIVECNEATWQRAGLDKLTEEETLAFCEELFAEELGGHRLLSNRSLWLSFLDVRNKSWHDGNVVLLGDAAHTAHFTIGSGTKLAMEDAVGLANAFVRHRDDVPAALVDYELERQPVVERFQQAATDSAGYFENVARYREFDPLQFGFNLLTRSGRITYTNLALRDAQFVRQLDAWFGANGASIAPPPMFAPLELPGLAVANRIVQAPVGEGAEPDGRPGEADAARLRDAAHTGAGLVLSGLVAAAPEGRTTPRCSMLETEAHAQAWAGIVADVHAAGAGIVLQLGHAGRRGATRPREAGVDLPLREGGWPLLAASPLPYTPRSPAPKAMDAGDLERVRAQFAAAAAHAAAAGFDALELDMAHGYLLAGFLSPLTNRRDDEYGGELEQRLRFPLEVLDAVRELWPADRLLAVRLSATDWTRRGSGLDEAVATARRLAAHGCGLIHVAAGQTLSETPGAEYRRGFLTALGDHIRSEAGVPTLVGGYLTTADEINTAVGAGRADLCVLADPGTAVRSGVQ
jgi:anthraniloyl-CoA monooxygenase